MAGAWDTAGERDVNETDVDEEPRLTNHEPLPFVCPWLKPYCKACLIIGVVGDSFYMFLLQSPQVCKNKPNKPPKPSQP